MLIERGWLAPRSVPRLRYHNLGDSNGPEIEIRFAETTADIGERELLKKTHREGEVTDMFIRWCRNAAGDTVGRERTTVLGLQK